MDQETIKTKVVEKLQKVLELIAEEKTKANKALRGYSIKSSDRDKLMKNLRIESNDNGRCRISTEDYHKVLVYETRAMKEGAVGGSVAGSVAGGAGGAAGGAVAGAAIGSIVPVAGTIVGGIIGGIIGAIGGAAAGGAAVGAAGTGIGAAVTYNDKSTIEIKEIFSRCDTFTHDETEKRVYCTVVIDIVE